MTPTAHRPSHLPVLVLLFVGSGCAALIYEVVWFQLLQLVIGSSAVSLGVLLATFMGGMCAGSLLFPRLVPPGHHPLRAYALLEIAIGAMGILLLFGLPLLSDLYAANVATGLPGVLMRALLCAVCLLPPTLLMGATLPAISRWVEATPQGVAWLGFFYGGNIAGAVLGTLLAGFLLLRLFDTGVATATAAAVNLAVAAAAWLLAARTPRPSAAAPQSLSVSAGAGRVYIAIALSGFCALGAQVLWTRALSLTFGGTVYAFSIILGAFLFGLGIGSSAGAWLARRLRSPGLGLAVCQALAVAALAWAAFLVHEAFPDGWLDPGLDPDPWHTFRHDLLRSVIVSLPATLLWGASFPLALAAAATRGQDPARLVGGVYAANTLGAIVGALAFSLFAIPAAGSQFSQRVLIGVAAASALLMLSWRPAGRLAAAPYRRGAAMAATVLFAALGAWSVAPLPPGLIGYGREAAWRSESADWVYSGEGLNASVALSALRGGTRYFHVSGKVEASTERQDMRLQRMLGHLSALMHPAPRSVLVVGFGAGVTAGAFTRYPGIERIVICEIEPLITRHASSFFARENYDVLRDPRVEVVHDDARHYVLTTGERFDVITSDPIHPWVKGAATLYTREYFSLVRDHLNPGGVVTQWVPLYETTAAAVRSEMATFFQVFPEGTVWGNAFGGGYDVVMLAGTQPLRIDVAALQARLDRADHRAVRASLGEVGFNGALDLLSTFASRGTELAPWLGNAAINRDRNLRLQYLAGLGLNRYESTRIYRELLAYGSLPEDLFIVDSPATAEALRQALARSRPETEDSLP